ncbi:putative nucleotide-diphospho-sugar transferase [Tropicibacter oceani]|uniref:Nucleotide-diphospho-sugar transferase n=1 Tax=Tropicibacter oceani TaxID=3058420 RepID=A0ABY8QIV1_9RHOB|nr:putative nucleotide-diphospho-sugar transferase [Tropicibacter oceani]WGW03921.1 putative nucleotide-diphospho-sugar transferase [Tropicibacter oceani]
MPDIAIDLFTDPAACTADPFPFDTVHPLQGTGPRPKMEALRRSRFERTLYLDCDVVMVTEVAPVFDVLEHFDIAGAQEQFGCAPIAFQGGADAPPVAFRQINSGVLGVRKSAASSAFLQKWEDLFRQREARFDQPLLTELLYCEPVRLAVLPQEYNLMYLPFMRNAVPGMMIAPRLLHLPFLHKGDTHLSPADQPFDLAGLLNDAQFENLGKLIEGDVTLGARPLLRHAVGNTLRKSPWLDRKLRKVLDWFA